MYQDIRWIQRFQNYSKAVAQLEKFLGQGSLNNLEVKGLIQCFEYTFELGWKTLKDYLKEEGIDALTPRKVIQEGFRAGIISDGHTWIAALESRNLMANSYTEENVQEGETLIRQKFFPMLLSLQDTLSKEL